MQEPQTDRTEDLNTKQFFVFCDQARLQYAELDEKIKRVELQVMGSISDQYDVKPKALFAEYISKHKQQQGISSRSGDEKMLEFIRAAYLDLIMARQKYVQQSKKNLRQLTTPHEKAKLVIGIEEETKMSLRAAEGVVGPLLVKQDKTPLHDEMMINLRAYKRDNVRAASTGKDSIGKLSNSSKTTLRKRSKKDRANTIAPKENNVMKNIIKDKQKLL